jgi:hypothetical protein
MVFWILVSPYRWCRCFGGMYRVHLQPATTKYGVTIQKPLDSSCCNIQITLSYWKLFLPENELGHLLPTSMSANAKSSFILGDRFCLL